MAKHLQLSFYFVLVSCMANGCSQTNQSPADTITTNISGSIANLDPIYATDANTQRANDLIHMALMRMGPDLRPVPDLAESFKVENEKTISFVLRNDCKFQNGRTIVAEDVQKSWQLYTDQTLASPFRESLSRIEKISIKNATHFTLHLREPSPSLLTDMIVLKILPAESYSVGNFKTKPIGAGPMSVVSIDQRQIVLTRNQTSCIPPPSFKNFVIKTVRDDLSRLLKLRTGELDIDSGELNFRKVERVLSGREPLLSAIVTDGVAYNYLGVNIDKAPLSDIRVRQAIAYSLDIQAITKFHSLGLQEPARNILTDKNFFANKELPIYARDLPKARELLDQAGFFNGQNDKQKLRVQLLTSNNPIAVDNAKILSHQASEAGIILEQRAYEWGAFLADVKARRTQLFSLRWVGATDPSIYAQAFHSGKIGRNNRTNYKNPDLDLQIEMAEVTMDQAKRKSQYDQIQKTIHHDLPYINLWHNKASLVFRKNIKNVSLLPNGSWRQFLTLQKENAN
jgi:peptide/nickel transport system substrate-binding protein